MSEAFICRRGGGAGDSLEVTGEITSPVSSVTVADAVSGRSYTKALNSRGKALFRGLKSGTWRITMTNGTETAEDSIVIDNEHECRMNYWDGNLYDQGNEYTDVTGGWDIYGTQIEKRTNAIYVKAQEWQAGNLITTKNSVNLSNYKTLHFYVNEARQNGATVFVTSTKVTSYADAQSRAVASFNIKSNTLNERTIDISSLTGSFYVSMGGRHYSGSEDGAWDYVLVNRFWVTK